jgi:hypothetical protein
VQRPATLFCGLMQLSSVCFRWPRLGIVESVMRGVLVCAALLAPLDLAQAQQKQIPVIKMPTMEDWLRRYKAQGWAKCRMSALDTFGLTQGKATTEIFVAIRQITDKMDELEEYLEKNGLSAQKLDEMRRDEARLISYMTLEQKSLLFKECALSVWE